MVLIGRMRVFVPTLLAAATLVTGMSQANDVVKDCNEVADPDERALCLGNAHPNERHHVHNSFSHRTVEIPPIPEIMGK
jgi:hypothetical protein